MRVSAIIPAAGQGKRMGSGRNKVYLPLDDQPILALTLQQLDAIDEIAELIVVVRSEEVEPCHSEIFSNGKFTKPYKVIVGGKERQDSVKAGLAALEADTDFVLVHDAARPLITGELIADALDKAQMYGSAVLAVPVKDTIKVIKSDGFVETTLERSALRAVQTPQIFRREIICKAYEFAEQNGCIATDDASLVEAMGEPVFLVSGSYENIKITTPEDILLAKEILRRRSKCE